MEAPGILGSIPVRLDDPVSKCFDNRILIVGRCFVTVIGASFGLSGLGSQISCSVICPISVNWCKSPCIRRFRISATVTALVIERPWALIVSTPRVVDCWEGVAGVEDDIEADPKVVLDFDCWDREPYRRE